LDYSLHGLHRQLRGGLPTKSNLATPYWCAIKTPRCSDQGADLGQHARGLDKYMANDIGKLSLKFFNPTTRYLCNLLEGSRTTCVHVILRWLYLFLHWFLATLGTGPAPEDYYFGP
jgi:hypothetical protein